MVEPFFAARTYTPARITVLPPDVFLIYDQFGENDPAKSAAIGQAVAAQSVGVIADALRLRGYDVDLSARWDGIVGPDGTVLIGRDELGALARSLLQFANSPAGGGDGPITSSSFIAPELATRVGAVTQSDAILYVNMKGVTVSSGKRAAQIAGVVCFVVIVAAIIALMLADSHGGGGGSGKGFAGAGAGSTSRGVGRASGGGGAAVAGLPGRAPGAGTPGGGSLVPPGRGTISGGGGGGHVYDGPRVGMDVGVIIPLNEPVYTHEGRVAEQDEAFAGDNMHVSFTLISAHDGRVLWHVRDEIDLAADRPRDVDYFVRRYLDTIPLSLAIKAPAAAGAH